MNLRFYLLQIPSEVEVVALPIHVSPLQNMLDLHSIHLAPVQNQEYSNLLALYQTVDEFAMNTNNFLQM